MDQDAAGSQEDPRAGLTVGGIYRLRIGAEWTVGRWLRLDVPGLFGFQVLGQTPTWPLSLAEIDEVGHRVTMPGEDR